MANNSPLIMADGIAANGIILWKADDNSGEPTSDINMARRIHSLSSGYSSFSSLYNLPMLRLIAGQSGRVHLKSVIQLPEALVQECTYHDREIQEYLENAPPGKYAAGTLVYRQAVLCLIQSVQVVSTYNGDGEKVEEVTYQVVSNSNETSVPEHHLSLLPNNFVRDSARFHQAFGLPPAYFTDLPQDVEVEA
ncbi:hypothetical protein PJWF_00098 [Achromobacter phage JWF]|uniref:hypothetical protein n=1 Tax=Achromobacter phage JWF TaxID=1589748 RepID=UPI000588E1E0|nr:hypothetical protein AXJ13_gp090 [Achromobacter phage JWF]AJD82991.1 hypothetical protein PJWF_00098 [Achromobacter phage JWF]